MATSPMPAMSVFYVVFLKKGPQWGPTLPPEQLDLQEKHMAYLTARAEEGVLVANGPADSPDTPHEIRGMSVYKANSVEHARELASGDPAVQSGRLMVEVYPFWFADDTFTRGM